MRPGARSTLIVGAALAAIALASVARADAHTVNLGLCPGSCLAPAIDDPPAAKNHAAARVTLSRSGDREPITRTIPVPRSCSSDAHRRF